MVEKYFEFLYYKQIVMISIPIVCVLLYIVYSLFKKYDK